MAHYYWPDGRTQHTIIGKNGKERDTIITDAKEMGLLASFSGVEKAIMVADGLQRWKEDEIIKFAAENPWDGEQPLEEWIELIREGGNKKSRDAMDFGSMVHSEIEAFHLNRNHPVLLECKAWLDHYKAWFYENIEEVYYAELTLGCSRVGLGGTIDAIGKHKEYGDMVWDFKTQGIPEPKPRKTGTIPEKNPKVYTSWLRQLAIYDEMYRDSEHCHLEDRSKPMRLMSVVINRDVPEPMYEHLWTDEDQIWGLRQARANIHAFYTDRKFYPEGYEYAL